MGIEAAPRHENGVVLFNLVVRRDFAPFFGDDEAAVRLHAERRVVVQAGLGKVVVQNLAVVALVLLRFQFGLIGFEYEETDLGQVSDHHFVCGACLDYFTCCCRV